MPESPGGKSIDSVKQVSRLEKMKTDMEDENYRPDMPEIDAPHIVEYLFDVGPAVNTGMGAVSLRSEHLIPWEQETGIELQPWEARFLRRLSVDYLVQAQKSEKIDCPPPYGFAERRAMVAEKIDAVFG